MGRSFITAAHVVKRFDKRNVIDDLSFTIQQGEITGLLGPNGSGKTTMVRLLNGVLRPNAGDISVAGRNPVDQGAEVRRMSGVLTESVDFYRHLSGLDNLRFYARLYGLTSSSRPAELLDVFGLGPHQDKKVGTYSTGMRKRLGLARALLHDPQILFLDEPTNGLDPEGTQAVLDIIKRLNREKGTTVLICSHLLNQMEAVCDRYLFINEGRLIEQGRLAELEQRHRGTITIAVETDIEMAAGERIHGDHKVVSVGAGRLGPHRVHLTAENTAEIPALLRALTQQGAVYSVRVLEQDLESLYFRIREAKPS